MKKFSFLILAAMLATACQKENTSPKAAAKTTQTNGTSTLQNGTSDLPGDGTYTGNFSSTAAAVPALKLPVRVVITADQFSSGHIGDNYYSVGEGTFVPGDGVLKFTNIDAFPDYMVNGSNVPLSSIGLSDNYKFSTKGDSLLLSKTIQGVTYAYALKKQ